MFCNMQMKYNMFSSCSTVTKKHCGLVSLSGLTAYLKHLVNLKRNINEKYQK